MTPLDAAITWIQKGFSPVPVPHRSKRPILQGWEQLEITTDAAPQYFNGKLQNIGLHLGDKYGSADVDCDCPEAITAARALLPETGMIFGRQSKPFSHFFYRADPPVRTTQFHDPLDHKTLIELRGLSSDGQSDCRLSCRPAFMNLARRSDSRRTSKAHRQISMRRFSYPRSAEWPPPPSLRATGRPKDRGTMRSWLWPACSRARDGASKMRRFFTA